MSKKEGNWYSILRFYRYAHKELLRDLDLLQKIGENNIEKRNDTIDIVCRNQAIHNEVVSKLKNPLCQRLRDNNLQKDLTVVWPIRCFEKHIGRSDEWRLKNSGVIFNFQEVGKVTMTFPNVDMLTEFRKDTLGVSLNHILPVAVKSDIL